MAACRRGRSLLVIKQPYLKMYYSKSGKVCLGWLFCRESHLSDVFVNLPYFNGLSGGQAFRTRLFASKEEAKVLKLCDEYPVSTTDPDFLEEMMTAAKKLPDAPGNAYELFLGDWKVEWSSMGGKAVKKKPDPNAPPMSLKFVSFAALPAVTVEFTGSLNRVTGDPSGGTYQLLQTFTMPGQDGPEAALVLEGTWGTGTATGNWGEGAPRKRVPTKFETVRLVPSAADPEASRKMLEEADLGQFMERTPVKAKETYIDLKHISEEMRAHQGESGAYYILTKMEDDSIPFLLD